MKVLSIVVAAFSALAFWVWLSAGETVVFLLAVSSATLATTTWLSPRISTYLRIFATAFAVETVVFGLCAFAVNVGWWSHALSGAQVSTILPLTVSVFGLLVFALSFVPVIRTVMRKADLYFEASETSDYRFPGLLNFAFSERQLGIAIIVFLIVLNQFQVYVGQIGRAHV